MIFSPELLPKVLDGTKTVTRRRVPLDGGDSPYRPGRTYAVQPGRGQRAVARIRILSVRREAFSDITAEEARREGFKDASAMRMWWTQRYGPEGYGAPVWRIEFELA